jgi:hypothetical protein
MDMKIWDVMVTVEVPRIGEFRHIGSALEAVDCLYSCWRGPRGDAHREAINTCLAVLDDDRPIEASRDAFIAAARDSHIALEC